MGGRIGWAGEKRFPKVPLQLPARIRTVCTGNTFGVDVETTLCLSGFVAERKAFPPTRWTPFPPPRRTRWALPYPPSALTMVAPQRACAAYRTVSYQLWRPTPEHLLSPLLLAWGLSSHGPGCFCLYKIFRPLRI